MLCTIRHRDRYHAALSATVAVVPSNGFIINMRRRCNREGEEFRCLGASTRVKKVLVISAKVRYACMQTAAARHLGARNCVT